MSESVVFFSGGFVPESEASIPAISNAVAFGESFFDTLRSYKGKFLRLEEHFHRLKKGAELLHVDIPFTLETFQETILQLLEKNDLLLRQAKIRTQIGITSKSFHPQKPDFFVLVEASELVDQSKSVELKTSPFKKIASDSLGLGLKSSQYLNNLIAFRDALSSGFDDALVCDALQHICETSFANIFWGKDGAVFTPGVETGILPGITRDFVIEALRDIGKIVKEGSFDVKELKSGDFVFITNSLKEWLPVSRIDDTLFETQGEALHAIIHHLETKRNAELC